MALHNPSYNINNQPPLKKKPFIKKKGVWIKKDGTEIKFSEMDYEYLKNCIKFLEKKCSAEEESFKKATGRGIKINPEDRYSSYKDLKEELKKRNDKQGVNNSFIYSVDDILGVEQKPKRKYKPKPTPTKMSNDDNLDI